MRTLFRYGGLRPGGKASWLGTETPIEALQPVYDAPWAALGRYRGPLARRARQEAENAAEANLRHGGTPRATESGRR